MPQVSLVDRSVLVGREEGRVLGRRCRHRPTRRPGRLVEVVHRIGTELSFLTTGQEVRDHIETARPDRLAELVIGEGALR